MAVALFPIEGVARLCSPLVLHRENSWHLSSADSFPETPSSAYGVTKRLDWQAQIRRLSQLETPSATYTTRPNALPELEKLQLTHAQELQTDITNKRYAYTFFPRLSVGAAPETRTADV